ncbi:MAG: hypothetical protein WAN61_01745 [Minisyncoccia bacterium]
MDDNVEEKKDITIDDLAAMVANGFKGMRKDMEFGFAGAKKDLELFKLDTNTHFNNIETDLKSFKIETRDNFKELNEKFDDLNDTVMNHDKRIEVLEEKVLA